MKLIEPLLLFAGWLHFAVLIASALTPGALDWKRELKPLHPFLRRLFWVYGAFIVLVIVAFGAITLLHAGLLAQGGPLARAFCLFVCAFWLARLGVQLFVFDARPFLVNAVYRIGYHGLTAVFTFFASVYGMAAFQPS